MSSRRAAPPPSTRRPRSCPDGSAGHQHGPLDGMVELRTLPGQRWSSRLHGGRVEAGQRLAVALRVLVQEVPREQRMSSRRRAAAARGSDRVQPEQQVLAECPAATSALRSALVAETRRMLTLRVFDEPRRSNSPVSMTRSSFCCWVSGTLAILVEEQRAAVASSKRLTRSALASVNEPLTWPNSSDSKTLGHAAGVDRHHRPPGSAATRRQRLRDQRLAGAVLAGDEDVGVGGTDAGDDLQDRPHRRRLGQDGRAAVGLQRLVGGLELPAAPDRPTELGLRADDREQPLVVPRLLHEVAGAAAHRLDGDVDRSPGGHHHDGQRLVGGVDALQQVEPLFAGRRVAGVVEVHQHDVVVAHLEGAQDLLRRGGRVDGVALGLEQEPQRFEDVGLVVGQQQARGRLSSHRPPSRPSAG